MTGARSVTIDGNTLDITLQLMLAAQHAAGIDGLTAAGEPNPVPAARERIRQLAASLPESEIHVDVTELAVPGPVGEIAARLYRPLSGRPHPLVVFFHGGGFVVGDLDSYDAVCRLTCRDAATAVLSIDYRLAPEHPAPAAVEDGYAAFRWACDHVSELGGIPGKVAVGGDSAGGNLAAVVALLARDAGGPQPVLQWLIYPVTDWLAQTRSRTLFGDGFVLTKRDIDWFRAHYVDASDVDPADPRISPLHATDLTGLPPALVAIAGFDPLRDEGERYAQALADAGNIVDLRRMTSLTHAFVNFFPLGGDSALKTAELVSALRAHLSRG